ncbi:MAG TPA: DinB family protein [bacterium]|nr:DinB family protein [bacterium]
MSPDPALTLRELVVDHVHTTLHDEEVQWQPPLEGALRGLTAAQAAWKPALPRHSIWQIVRHLLLWKRGVLRAWDGDPPDGHQLAGADWKDAAGTDAEWERDRKALLDISAEFLARAQTLDEAGLSRRIMWYKSGWTQPLAMRIVRTTTHDIYHAGQIMYLRALQGVPPR